MSTAAFLYGVICLAAAAALVGAEWRRCQLGRWIFKILASTAFLAAAFAWGATASPYGKLLLAALCLSWAGDLLLLPRGSTFFRAGIGAFFLAHVLFAIAFSSRPLDTQWLFLGSVPMTAIALVTVRWLWPHLSSFYKGAVLAYVAAITVMVSFAIGATPAPGGYLIGFGAVAFAVSDIFVARDRFVSSSLLNKAWGLPLYYAAQLLLASSVRLAT